MKCTCFFFSYMKPTKPPSGVIKRDSVRSILNEIKKTRKVICIDINEAIKASEGVRDDAPNVTIISKKPKRIKKTRNELALIRQRATSIIAKLKQLEERLNNFMGDTLDEVSKIKVYGEGLRLCHPDQNPTNPVLQTSLFCLHTHDINKDTPKQIYKKRGASNKSYN